MDKSIQGLANASPQILTIEQRNSSEGTYGLVQTDG